MSRDETTAESFGHDASGTLIFDSDGDTVRVLREDASRLVTLLLLDLSPEERRLVHEMTTPECRGPCAHEARCSKTAKPLRVGDRVSVPRYPRGTVQREGRGERDGDVLPLRSRGPDRGRPGRDHLVDDGEGEEAPMRCVCGCPLKEPER